MNIRRSNECECGAKQDATHLIYNCPIFTLTHPCLCDGLVAALADQGRQQEVLHFLDGIYKTLTFWGQQRQH